VDGNDVEAVHAAVHAARQRALAGGGPTLVEARTMRMHGHGAHDDQRYVDPELLASWTPRDPLARYDARLSEQGVDTAAVREDVAAELEQAVTAALASPLPDPAVATSDVFCSGEPATLGRGDAPWSAFAGEATA
jgi:pyruvate dehydrogenase E1 component alpha subunit